MIVLVLIAILSSVRCDDCVETQTTVSGVLAPSQICSGDLIFEDDFDVFDLKKWEHEVTLSGGGNWEFQWYTNNRSNSYVENGYLFIKPTLTSDQYGEDFLYKGTLDLNGGTPADHCTDPSSYGCTRSGSQTHIINPIKSARIRTAQSFNFKYGRVEIKAKMPFGDWLWPAIWLMPRYNQYGSWPTSGEIDVIEARGNRNATLKGEDIGSHLVTSTLHWGPSRSENKNHLTSWKVKNQNGFDEDFHVFELIWTKENVTFLDNGDEYGFVSLKNESLWDLGNLSTSGYSNPYKSGSNIAPFDEEFYLIVNLAVGGVTYFPDDAEYDTKKPWSNNSPKAATDFWEGKEDWLPTWSEKSTLQIDYIKIYAL